MNRIAIQAICVALSAGWWLIAGDYAASSAFVAASLIIAARGE